MKKIINRTPDFSRMRKVLQRTAEPDCVPFYELFADVEIMSAILERPITTIMDRVDYHAVLGYDYAVSWVGVNLPVKGRMSTIDTAELTRQTRTYNMASMSTIASWEDFDNYPWPKINEINYEDVENLVKILPEGMKTIVLTGHVLEDPMSLSGYEGLSYLMADEPGLVEAIFDKIGEIYESVYKNCVDIEGVGAMLISDDLAFKSATMISPIALRRLVFPWYRKYVEICHAKNIPVILHSCGNLTEVMDDIIDYCMIDAKHSFEDQILPVTEAKARYGNRISLLGGIDVDFLCRATEGEVRERTRQTLEKCMPKGGYALGTGNSVANYIPVRNFLAMLDEGARSGRY